MKIWKVAVTVLLAMSLAGCACNPGYFAPPYKLTTVGCAPAFVPAR